MPVSADQVATIRAYLAGEFYEYERLHGSLDRSKGTEFSALLTAAFSNAVRQRFLKGTKASDVVDFVGDVRVRYEELGEHLDPLACERMIRSMLTNEDVDDLDTATRVNTQLYLLYVLVADQQLDDAGLDEFMTKARTLADKAIG